MTFWETVLALVVGFAIRDAIYVVLTATLKMITFAIKAWANEVPPTPAQPPR